MSAHPLVGRTTHGCGLTGLPRPSRYGGYVARSPRASCRLERRSGARPPDTMTARAHPPGTPPRAAGTVRGPPSAAAVRRRIQTLPGLLPPSHPPHAARSPASPGGGAPPRGTTPVHTKSCPHAGQRSGCRVTPLRTRRLPVERHGDLHRRLPERRATDGQGLHLGGMIQPVGPHHPRLRHRHMQEPPLEEVGHGQGHTLGRGAAAVGLRLPGTTGEGHTRRRRRSLAACS